MRLYDGRALPAFIGQSLRGEDLTVFGDGSQTRSFCFVDDLVEGIYRLLMSDYHLPVNIGNPAEITLKEFDTIYKNYKKTTKENKEWAFSSEQTSVVKEIEDYSSLKKKNL